MDYVFLVLILATCIATFVGLIKPTALRIKWLSSRLRVFGIGIVTVFLLLLILGNIIPETEEMRRLRLASESKETRTEEEADSTAADRTPKEATGDLEEAESEESKKLETELNEHQLKLLKRRTEDPSYLPDLRKAIEDYRALIYQAKAAMEKRNFEVAYELFLKGEDLFSTREVYYWPKEWLDGSKWKPPYTWYHPEEEIAYNENRILSKIARMAKYKTMERKYADQRALLTREGSFERVVELAILEKFYHVQDGHVSRIGLDESGSRSKRFVKDIDFSNEILTVSLRAGSDAYDMNYRTGAVTLTHPIRTMRYSKGFFGFILNANQDRWPESINENLRKVNEIVIALYFPGQRADEIVVARYGLKRSIFEATLKQRRKWAKLKAKDGTFQDFLKVHGTYYLHREMPDLGTPAHVLRGR